MKEIEEKTTELLRLLCENITFEENERNKIINRVPDELTEYAFKLIKEGKLEAKYAFSESIDWFGTVCGIDDGNWTTTRIVSNVTLKNFKDEGIYPLPLVLATWMNGEREIKTNIPPSDCEMVHTAEGMQMKCGLWLSRFAFYLTPERYAEIAAIVRDKNMKPSISVEVTYFNKSGVEAIITKLFEIYTSK